MNDEVFDLGIEADLYLGVVLNALDRVELANGTVVGLLAAKIQLRVEKQD